MPTEPPSPPGIPARSIAIVGMQGCGKTVFITTLAKRLSFYDHEKRTFLNPVDARTLKYVEKNWRILESGDWPPSTPSGTTFDLQWTFRAGEAAAFSLRLVDMAGHDLRLIFADDQSESPDLPAALKPLIKYCRDASIVIFMVNLKDFVGAGASDARTENEAALKSAMDYLTKAGKSCALVFTQSDQYKDYVEQNGGWIEVAKKEIPYVYGAHLTGQGIPVFPVAAVADTVVRSVGDGPPSRMPAPDFRSDGLEPVLDWMTGAAAELDKAEREKAERERADKYEEQRVQAAREKGAKVVKGVVAVVFVALVAWGCVGIASCVKRKRAAEVARREAEVAEREAAITRQCEEWRTSVREGTDGRVVASIRLDLMYDNLYLVNASDYTLLDVRMMVRIVQDGRVLVERWLPAIPSLAPSAEKEWKDVVEVRGNRYDGSTAAYLRFHVAGGPHPPCSDLELGYEVPLKCRNCD